jgi:hypothetical protein
VKSPAPPGLGDSRLLRADESPSPDTLPSEKSSCRLASCLPATSEASRERVRPAAQAASGPTGRRPGGSPQEPRTGDAQPGSAASTGRLRSTARQGPTTRPAARTGERACERAACPAVCPGPAGKEAPPRRAAEAGAQREQERGRSPSTAHKRSDHRERSARSERASSPDRPASAPSRSHVLDHPEAPACRRPGRPSARPDRREGPLQAVSYTRRNRR